VEKREIGLLRELGSTLFGKMVRMLDNGDELKVKTYDYEKATYTGYSRTSCMGQRWPH
jgi:hypothetical protein